MSWSRSEDVSSIHSVCSASSSQPRATSSNALFMDRLLVWAARFLASAALCRYVSARDDMQGEHWKDDSVPQISPNRRQAAGVSQLVMTRSALRCGKSRPVVLLGGGSGRSKECAEAQITPLIAAGIRIFSLAPQSSNQFASRRRTAFGRPAACRNVTVLASRFPALGPMPHCKKPQLAVR